MSALSRINSNSRWILLYRHLYSYSEFRGRWRSRDGDESEDRKSKRNTEVESDHLVSIKSLPLFIWVTQGKTPYLFLLCHRTGLKSQSMVSLYFSVALDLVTVGLTADTGPPLFSQVPRKFAPYLRGEGLGCLCNPMYTGVLSRFWTYGVTVGSMRYFCFAKTKSFRKSLLVI